MSGRERDGAPALSILDVVAEEGARARDALMRRMTAPELSPRMRSRVATGASSSLPSMTPGMRGLFELTPSVTSLPAALPQPEYSLLSLTIWEQQALIAAFEKEDPDNNGLTSEQFRRAAGNFLASKTTSDPAAIFAIFDTNGTGRITKREFLCGYAILCKGSTDQRIRYLFNMFDVSDDGALGRDQLIAALRLVAKCARSADTVTSPLPPSTEQYTAALTSSRLPTDVKIEAGPPDGHAHSASEVEELEIAEIADTILDGADDVTYADFFDIVTAEPTVMTWLESLAAGAGEFMNDLRAMSESALREVSLLRAKVIGPEYPTSPHGTHRATSPKQRAPVAFGSPPPIQNLRSPQRLRRAAASMPNGGQFLARHREKGGQQRMQGHCLGSKGIDSFVGDSARGDAHSDARPAVDPSDLLIDYDSIRFKKEIGRGSCATVYAAEWLHMPVAVKVFDRQTAVFAGSSPDETNHEEQQRDVMSEINVLTKLRHPNICLYMGMCMTKDRICIVSELYFGGSVHEFLHGVKPRRFTPRQALDMISDVAQAMEYLHSKTHVLHRDLKASNILVNAAVTNCVICDFGLSKLIKDDSGQTDSVSAPRGGVFGTPYTMAPEVIRGERYTSASDVYSFGIVAWEMWTGEMPFEGLKPIQIMYKVAQGGRPPLIVEKIGSQKFANLLQACWAHNPDDRPNFDSILFDLEDKAMAEDVDALQSEYQLLMKRTSQDAILDERQKIDVLSRNLMDVMHTGDFREAARLLAAGAEVQFADYDRRRPLHIAAAEGHMECVKLLLKHGARVLSQDRWGGTPIDDAKQGGHRDVVALLLAARDNPDQARPSSSSPTVPKVSVGSEDGTVVVESSAHSNVSIAESQDDVSGRKSRMRVSFEMMFAVYDHDIGAVRKFVAGNADVNGTDYDQRTPLHIAAACGDKEIAQLLVQSGANVCAVDRWGIDALTEAERSGHPDVAKIIEKARIERQSASSEQNRT